MPTHDGVSASVYTQEKERLVRGLVEKYLTKHGGNRTRTAKALGIDRNYLRYLLRRYNLK